MLVRLVLLRLLAPLAAPHNGPAPPTIGDTGVTRAGLLRLLYDAGSGPGGFSVWANILSLTGPGGLCESRVRGQG